MKAVRRSVKFAPRLGSDPVSTKYVVDPTLTAGGPLRRTLTQQDQDEEDDEKRREALRNLVESWMDRLQLISVITTFFASTEASMITITAPSSDGTPISLASQFANIGILGALVVHSNAAIISFLAAFFLVRYKLRIAKDEEKEAEENMPGSSHAPVVQSPCSATSVLSNHDAEKADDNPRRLIIKTSNGPNWDHDTDPIPGPVRIISPTGSQTVWSKNPHLVQVGPFNAPQPPTHLLSRCHTLCIFLTAVGFVLALMGILCFAWDRLPLSVSISSSVIMALCVLSGLYIVYKPIPPEHTMSRRIYCD